MQPDKMYQARHKYIRQIIFGRRDGVNRERQMMPTEMPNIVAVVEGKLFFGTTEPSWSWFEIWLGISILCHIDNKNEKSFGCRKACCLWIESSFIPLKAISKQLLMVDSIFDAAQDVLFTSWRSLTAKVQRLSSTVNQWRKNKPQKCQNKQELTSMDLLYNMIAAGHKHQEELEFVWSSCHLANTTHRSCFWPPQKARHNIKIKTSNKKEEEKLTIPCSPVLCHKRQKYSKCRFIHCYGRRYTIFAVLDSRLTSRGQSVQSAIK